MNERARGNTASTNLCINLTADKNTNAPQSKPVLVWETRQKREQPTRDKLVPMRRPAREEGIEREATTMEWTVGAEEGSGKEEASVTITVVSSGFGGTIQASSAAQPSSGSAKMCLAA